MYSNEDFENFYVRYKAEALPKGISIQSWCMKNKVSWNLFNKWYRDTRHRIVPVDVEGHPAEEETLRKDMQAMECADPDSEPFDPYTANGRTPCFTVVRRWPASPLSTAR